MRIRILAASGLAAAGLVSGLTAAAYAGGPSTDDTAEHHGSPSGHVIVECVDEKPTSRPLSPAGVEGMHGEKPGRPADPSGPNAAHTGERGQAHPFLDDGHPCADEGHPSAIEKRTYVGEEGTHVGEEWTHVGEQWTYGGQEGAYVTEECTDVRPEDTTHAHASPGPVPSGQPTHPGATG